MTEKLRNYTKIEYLRTLLQSCITAFKGLVRMELATSVLSDHYFLSQFCTGNIL